MIYDLTGCADADTDKVHCLTFLAKYPLVNPQLIVLQVSGPGCHDNTMQVA